MYYKKIRKYGSVLYTASLFFSNCKTKCGFDKILTFSVARGFDFVLSLGVTTPLITPVMGNCCPGSFGKDCFDMLQSIGFGDLVRLFSSSRRSDSVYLG